MIASCMKFIKRQRSEFHAIARLLCPDRPLPIDEPRVHSPESVPISMSSWVSPPSHGVGIDDPPQVQQAASVEDSNVEAGSTAGDDTLTGAEPLPLAAPPPVQDGDASSQSERAVV